MQQALTLADTEEGAIQEAREGNPDAFRVLVERHSRQIYRLCYRMTLSPEDAEELVQETFLRACRQLKKFDGRASFGSWLYRIATNCALDHLRAAKARKQRMLSPREHDEEQDGVMDRIASAEPDPERLSLSNEIARHLKPAMSQLSGQERAAFVMRHHQGMSIEEIGEAMGLRPSAVKHSIFRAVQKLRRVLEPLVTARENA